MKVDIKKLAKSQVELTITVPYDFYQKWEKKALEDLSKQIKMDGFRSGHIPEEVIREKVSKEAIENATLDYVLPQSYSAAVKENDVQVIARPKVEVKEAVKKESDNFVYVATVAVMPDIKMGNYKKIKVKKKPVKVEKKNIDETIRMIMDRHAEWKDVDRKAKKGDRVEIDFEGFDEEDKALKGTASKNHPVVLGSNALVPGFEDEIIDMSKGENKEFQVTFPEDYHAEPMRGKKVKFKTTVSRLEEKTDQELNDDFIEKIMGQKLSVDDFKKKVEDDLHLEIKGRIDQDHYAAVVQEIIKITQVDLPDELVEQEVDMMLQEQKQRVEQQRLSWDQYLSHIKKSEEDFKKEHQKMAEERLTARLGVQNILKEAKIKVEDSEIQAKIDAMLARYPETEVDKIKEVYAKGSEAYKNLRHSIAADKLIEMMTK